VYILDSSAIAIALKRLREELPEFIDGKTTLDLTRYELGNVIWKECALERLISPEEALNRAEDMAKILEITRNERVETSEDFRGAMRLATELRATFYDASYLHIAKIRGLTLVTEDDELGEKAERANIKAIGVSEFLTNTSVKKQSIDTGTKSGGTRRA